MPGSKHAAAAVVNAAPNAAAPVNTVATHSVFPAAALTPGFMSYPFPVGCLRCNGKSRDLPSAMTNRMMFTGGIQADLAAQVRVRRADGEGAAHDGRCVW